MGFHEETCRMQVESLHPGVTFDQAQQNTGFVLGKAARVAVTEPPTAGELRILRDEVDPYRYVIGR
jgi:glutaconate CoA-transferase subunit B